MSQSAVRDPWPWNDRPADLSLTAFAVNQSDDAEICQFAWTMVLRGAGEEYVAEYIGELLSDTDCADLPDSEFARMSAHLFAARRAQQHRWVDRQITPNLTSAFADLEAAAILARGDFSCCGTCAAGEIWDERDDSRHWRGYVTFTTQDTESMLEDGSVYLSYGIFPPEGFDPVAYDQIPLDERESAYRAEFEQFMTEVLSILDRHQLQPSWNNGSDTRVLLSNPQWYVTV
ncbi:MAG: hypothetical protein ABI206_04935 [Antricoccus sp.]